MLQISSWMIGAWSLHGMHLNQVELGEKVEDEQQIGPSLKTNSSPLKRFPVSKRDLLFQGSIF